MAAILEQRWLLQPEDQPRARQLAEAVGISPLLAQILLNRGLRSPAEVRRYLQPDPSCLPPPSRDFADLPLAVELLEKAPAPAGAHRHLRRLRCRRHDQHSPAAAAGAAGHAGGLPAFPAALRRAMVSTAA
jgi:hypothetical protein